MTPPTYRERLRREGFTLAICGALAAIVLLAATDEAARNAASTIVQLTVVAALMATLGTRSVRRALAGAEFYEADTVPGDGEPTPLWQIVGIVAGLTLAFGLPAGWDAGVRVGGGCVIVGLSQALLFERLVARAERAGGRRFHRIPGSSLFTGTRLGAVA